ncbi:MAG TPA: hypothetical protein VIV06_03735, partial [Candidatus Limnocylindrales bacterium]
LAVAGDWLAVGLDLRPERFAAFPWRRSPPPSLEGVVEELIRLGVARFVLSHAGRDPDAAALAQLVRSYPAEYVVAGAADLAAIGRLRSTGVQGVIIGEPLLSGALDFTAAREAAA